MPRINLRLPERSTTPRGIKFCKSCMRKHASNAVCNLYFRDRVAKSGNTVKRWCA